MKYVRTVNLLVIVALILMGISPACKFISGASAADGQGVIEICTADGLVKRIALADGQEVPETPPHNHDKNMNDCMFCFAHASQIKHFSGAQTVVYPPVMTAYIAIGSGLFMPAGQERAALYIRGPPLYTS